MKNKKGLKNISTNSNNPQIDMI